MKLKILSSSSKGNCYLLMGETETLILECGVKFSEIKKGLNGNLLNVAGALCTHLHLDHSLSVNDVENAGITVFTNKSVIEKHNLKRAIQLNAKEIIKIGQFKVIPFDVKHDVPTFGFLINHAECGTVLFATDTYYLKNTFPGLNNIIIEANYCDEILQQRIDNGANTYLSDRVIKSHMSIQNCIKSLESNDLSNVNNIVLIHLSDGNSNAIRFKEMAENSTCKNVTIADVGVEISFNETPF